MTKTNPGNFFEDFQIGQQIEHATPRTITAGDVALYTGLYGSRFAVQSSAEFARDIGFSEAPIDDLLTFHIVFGKTVPDISLNAVANLGYAEGKFIKPVFPGDTLSAHSEVIGLKENSNGKTGVVYVRSTGLNQHNDEVLSYVRWVMVRKGHTQTPTPETILPQLKEVVSPEDLSVPANISVHNLNHALSGSSHIWDDFKVGEKIDHIDGMTVEESDHMLATRLYQNTAKVHFNQFTQSKDRFGKRLIYGGHVISLARALSFNGLANAHLLLAINGGTHAAPLFAGDTVFAWSEVLEKADLKGDNGLGALRLRLVATKNRTCQDFPLKGEEGKYEDGVILDFDYWAAIAR